MEGSTLAKLSQERSSVSHRVAQVRRQRSDDGGSGGSAGLERGNGRAAGTTVPGRRDEPSILEPSESERAGPVSAGPRPVVAITGAAHGLGPALTARLAESELVSRVIAIDGSRGDVSGVTWRIVDVRDPALAGRLADVDVIVHTDIDVSPETDARTRRAYNVRGVQTVLTAAAAGGVSRVVLVTSAMVYGARSDNLVPLPEDAPLSADADDSVVGDLLEIEHLAERARHAHLGLQVSVARPAALVGDGIDTLITRHFEAPRLLAVKGCTARWQFCHVDDLVGALELAAAGRVTGAFAVGSDGWLEQDQLEQLTGMRRIELPPALTFATAQRLHRAGLTPAPGADLRYVVYPWVVDCKALREAGWLPVHDNGDAVQVLLDQRAGHHALAGRRLARKDAAITAAGATVAVVGTAAIVRQVRRRRRGS
ncbi:MAG: NAD-dependent epimerase/dehydratase family protein [Actinobacteria bacterium]|nr:NAD-dependent epimerase/dehydratase family protein [Actinomycetota bacterium]